mgnify:CR=1 FL=1
MKYTTHTAVHPAEILCNDHYAAIPYDCSGIAANSEGIIPAGTIVPANDATAIGVLLSDVVKAENPNGTIVVHGFVKPSKLPAAPSAAAITALASGGVRFLNAEGVPLNAKCTVTYDANGGTGSVTDSSSPYAYGAEVTVKPSTGLTPPASKTFSGWALTADAAAKDDAYDPSDKFVITKSITLYAVYA